MGRPPIETARLGSVAALWPRDLTHLVSVTPCRFHADAAAKLADGAFTNSRSHEQEALDAAAEAFLASPALRHVERDIPLSVLAATTTVERVDAWCVANGGVRAAWTTIAAATFAIPTDLATGCACTDAIEKCARPSNSWTIVARMTPPSAETILSIEAFREADRFDSSERIERYNEIVSREGHPGTRLADDSKMW